jgi:hypothetical protein
MIFTNPSTVLADFTDSGFTNPYKKSAKEENSSLFTFCRTRNEDRKPDKNSNLRRVEFMPRNLN